MFMWLADQIVYRLLDLKAHDPVAESLHFFIMVIMGGGYTYMKVVVIWSRETPQIIISIPG